MESSRKPLFGSLTVTFLLCLSNFRYEQLELDRKSLQSARGNVVVSFAIVIVLWQREWNEDLLRRISMQCCNGRPFNETRMGAQARGQLSSRTRHAARASFIKDEDAHLSAKESSYNRMFCALKGPHARDWQCASNLLTERPAMAS